MKTITFITLFLATFAPLGFSKPLYTQQGDDPPFEEVMRSGKLPVGSNSKRGVTGSKIRVNRQLVERTPEAGRPIPRNIRIHTLGNSVIPRRDFGKWSRWYQEDGSTQVFRLFKGETNVRNERKLAARVEAFGGPKWKRGRWHEWSGTYTIIKPHGAAIFQAKNNGAPNWAVQLTMNSRGDVTFSPRHKPRVVIAKNMTGKPFHIRVRDNGHDFEVYLDGRKVGTGSWNRPEGETGFRWGMYVGANEVQHDAMIFVSGVTVDGRSADRPRRQVRTTGQKNRKNPSDPAGLAEYEISANPMKTTAKYETSKLLTASISLALCAVANAQITWLSDDFNDRQVGGSALRETRTPRAGRTSRA